MPGPDFVLKGSPWLLYGTHRAQGQKLGEQTAEMQTEDDVQEIMAAVGKSPLFLDMFEGKTDTCIVKWNVKADIKEHEDKKQSFWIAEPRRRLALEKGTGTFWMALCSNWPCGCSCAELEMLVEFSGEI